jgi:hypothetical protein
MDTFLKFLSAAEITASDLRNTLFGVSVPAAKAAGRQASIAILSASLSKDLKSVLLWAL